MILLWIFAGAVGIVVLLLAVCLVRALRLCPDEEKPAADFPPEVDVGAAAEHLSAAIRCKTVSYPHGEGTDWTEFEKLHRFLESAYPLTHSTLERETVDGYSLLYRWKGKNGDKLPVLLMAHQDVVPAEEGEGSGWSVPPFAGEIREGAVWGRGAFDMKCQLIAIFEAAEALLQQGFSPQRDVYFCFTHNEEVTPETGAQHMAALLKKRGMRFALILDEGGYAFRGASCGMARDGIQLGLCEKGYADLRICARCEGGHSSIPPEQTALGRVCAAVNAIQTHQPRPRFHAATAAMYDAMAPYMPLGQRFLYVNRWLFGRFLLKRLAREKQTNAYVRTTVAPTMARGAQASNVLPQYAEAIVNFRIAPGETAEGLLASCKRITWGMGVELSYVQCSNPTPVSPTAGEAYRILSGVIGETFPDLALVPYAMMAATDSRYFAELSQCVYRFSPFRCAMEVLGTMHGSNERVTIDSLREGIAFFLRLLRAL